MSKFAERIFALLFPRQFAELQYLRADCTAYGAECAKRYVQDWQDHVTKNAEVRVSFDMDKAAYRVGFHVPALRHEMFLTRPHLMDMRP